jgi:hypothetical protein
MFGDPREDGRGFYICGLLGEGEFYEKYQRLSGLTIDPVRLKWYSVLNCYQALVSTLGSLLSRRSDGQEPPGRADGGAEGGGRDGERQAAGNVEER